MKRRATAEAIRKKTWGIDSGGCCPDCNNDADNPCDYMKE